MSKDMLGSVIRAAVSVPQKRLDLLAKIASSFADDNPEGEAWHKHLGTTVKLGLPKTGSADPPKLELTITELGEFEVNYDETIVAKLARNGDPQRIGWHNRDWATDERFPDTRTGKKRYKASAVNFGQLISDEEVAKWCKDHKKIRATPKEGIDLALVSPRPTLDNVIPLVMAGQFFVGASRGRSALYFDRDDAKRNLNNIWLNPTEQWNGNWWFLVLATSRRVQDAGG